MNENTSIRLNVHANTAIAKFWDHLRPVILGLEGKSDDLIICGEAKYVLTVRHSADKFIVVSASIPVMDYYWFWSHIAKFLKRRDEFRGHDATITVWTREFDCGEVWRQVTQ